MTKAELVTNVASETGYTKKDITTVVEAMTSVITSELSQGGFVKLPGIGTFTVIDIPSRPGRNPKTGEDITIGEYKKVKFKSSATLKSAVN